MLLEGNGKAQCRTTRFVSRAGRFDYVALCTNKRFIEPLTVRSAGTYTSTAYTIRSVSTGTRNGRPIRIETTGSGKRTGACV